MKRLLSLLISTAIASSPSLTYASPTPQNPNDELTLFEQSLHKKMDGTSLSATEQADTLQQWINSLRRNVFAQGSADENSKYYTNHPLDSFALAGQEVALGSKGKPKFDFVERKKITLEILNSAGEVVRYLNPQGKDLRFLFGEKGAITKGRYFAADQEMNQKPDELYTFRISYQGQVLHEFQNNIQSAVFMDRYLVFLEPSRIVADKAIVNLSVIDLDYFNSALAKTVLPVYRLPLHLSAPITQPENLKLEYTDKGIQITDKLVSKELIGFYSQIQHMSFNVTASLVDPQYYKDMAPVINDFYEVMEQSIQDVPEEMKAQMERAGNGEELFKKFLSTVKSEMHVREQVGAIESTTNNVVQSSANQLDLESTKEFDQFVLENLNRDGVWDKEKYPDLLALSPEDQKAWREETKVRLSPMLPTAIKENVDRAKTFARSVENDKGFQATLDSFNKSIVKEKKLSSRLALLWARMNFPQPLGAKKIKHALGFIASNLSDLNQWRKGSFLVDSLKEATLEILGNRKIQAISAATAGGLLGMFYPEEAGMFYLSALDAGRQVQDGIIGWGADLWHHTKTTWNESWAWLNPDKIYSTFLAPDKIDKLAIGVTALTSTLLFTAGTIHSIVNSVHYFRALSDGRWQQYRESGLNWFQTWRQSFIDYMRESKKQYYQHLGNAEAKRQGTVNQTELSSEEKAQIDEQVDQILSELKDQSEESQGLLSSMKNWPLIRNFVNRRPRDIETWGQAIRHFLVGYSSWTHSTKVFGKIWNPWFLARNFWLNTRSLITMLVYPNYFNRAVKGAPGGHFPTVYNGGKRPLYETKGFFYLAGVENVEELMSELDKWEKSIIPTEQLIHKASLKQAYKKIVEMAATDPDLLTFVRQGPFTKLTKDNYQRLELLPKKIRIYFHAYFSELFKQSMQQFFRSRLGIDPDVELSEQILKSQAIGSEVDISISESDAEAIVANTAKNGSVEEFAQRTAFDFLKGFWQRMKMRHMDAVDRTMNPQYKYALNRYIKAEEKMEDPEAMARATRQMMVGMITDKPMELFFTFLFVAGIDQGVLKPLQDNMFDENSWFHLSRFVFWNGYLTGIIINLLAEVWMKIQMDARLDDLNELDKVPTPAEAKKGYFHWLRKSTFKKSNSLWENYKYGLKLTFANMQAYLMTAVITNMAFLGRFDLDTFIMTYIGALIPLGALHMKIDQGFELSNKFDLAHFPQKAWSHPKVQEYRAKKMASRRIWVNLFNNFWANIVGNIQGNWMLLTSIAAAPRTLTRLLFAGFLPTEIVVNNVLRPVGDNLGGVVERVTNACETFLTNNHTDAIKITPKAKVGP